MFAFRCQITGAYTQRPYPAPEVRKVGKLRLWSKMKAVASGAADIFAARSGPADCWAIEGTFIGGAEAALVDFLAPGCGAGSAVTNVALKIARRRGAWEAWDEADAQLALEESW